MSIERTGFEYGFEGRIEPLATGKCWRTQFLYHSIGITNQVFISKYLGLKKDSFRLMFYDYDSKIMILSEFKRILEAFSNDILLFETAKGYHFVSLCEDISDVKPEVKASKLSEALNQDYYRGINYDYLTLRVIPKRHKNSNRVHKKEPRFVKMIREPRAGSRCSYEHLKIYTKLGIDKATLKLYFRLCVICKWKTNYFFYRCKQ